MSSSDLPSDPILLRAIVEWYEAAGFMHHAFDTAVAPVERLPPDPPTAGALDAARRVVHAYQRARKDGIAARPSMWLGIEHKHAAFLAAMEAGEIETVQRQLGAMLQNDLTWGLARVGLDQPGTEPVVQAHCTDLLRSLGEACAVARVISLEQQGGAALRTALKIDVGELLAGIERTTGLDVSCAAVGGPRGCRIGRRLFNADSLLHSYTVYRLRQLGAHVDSTVIEIGGGYGCLAELFARAGLRRYTIYDLPWVNALQGYYLIMACPGVTVRLYGETSGDLAVLPFWSIDDRAERSIDFAINVNSMPEMHARTVREYVAVLARILRGSFLSINQEAMAPAIGGPQQWVHDVVSRDGRLTCTSRQRWWMEQGYVEELYEPRTR